MAVVPSTSHGGAPIGTAGGDLTGTYPNPGVGFLNGVAINNSPSAGLVLTGVDGSNVSYQAAGGGSSPVLVDTSVLTNAQVLALPTTPIQLVAAPGASKIIVPIHATLRLAWTADYTGIDVGGTLFIEDGTAQSLALLSEARNTGLSGLLAMGESAIALLPPLADVTAVPLLIYGTSGFLDSDIENKAVRLAATNTLDFTGGNAANTLTVTLLYYIVDF